MKKPTVAVVFGSRSTEHDISILTALAAIIKPLELSQKYHVLPVYIAKDGRWFAGAKFKNITLYQSGAIDDVIAKEAPVSLTFTKGLALTQATRFTKKTTAIDVVFPATHGTHGEDGELAAICQMADVPYVGCDMASSAIAMDKVLAKQVVEAASIPTPRYLAFSKQAYQADPTGWQKRISEDLRYPLFVKPAHLGSSIGITRVKSKKELEAAIEVALHYDTKALAEEGVANLIEVTLPIIGNEDLSLAYVEQPLTSSEDFFDFDTKYMRGGKGGKTAKSGGGKGTQGAQGYSKVPADISKELYQDAETVATAVYRALGCSGIARVDMLIDSAARKVYFNEVNPLPGSLYAHNWRKKGTSNVELVTRLIELAFDKHSKQQAQATNFSTSFLKQF